MSQPKVIEGHFIDRMGEKRIIRKTRHGLQIQRKQSTVALTLNTTVAPMIGQRIKKARQAKRMSLAELCERAGIVSATPKSRMWEIENSTRKEGLRFGTLYAIAIALNVDIHSLIPTTAEVQAEATVGLVIPKPRLSLNGRRS